MVLGKLLRGPPQIFITQDWEKKAGTEAAVSLLAELRGSDCNVPVVWAL